MKKVLYKIITVTILFLSFSVFADDISDYKTNQITDKQQQQLISNLNYIQYAIAKIKATDNKAIAEDEYYSVINQIKIETINNSELINLYENFLNGCVALKLNQNEKEFITSIYKRRLKDAYKSAFTSAGSIFVGGVRGFTPTDMAINLGISLAYTTLANVTTVMNTKSQLQTDMQKAYFYLDQDMLQSLYDMQTTLFLRSSELLSKNKNKIDGRINEDSMKTFINIINNTENPSIIIGRLKEKKIVENFSVFPPFWYYLGSAYQNIGDYKNAEYCYDKFEELKKGDVVEKDSLYVNLARNRIAILLKDENKINQSTINLINHYLNIIDENTLDSASFEKNFYFANVYYSIKEYYKALKCIDHIISSGKDASEFLEVSVQLKLLILTEINSSEIYTVRGILKNSIVFGNRTDNYTTFKNDNVLNDLFKSKNRNIFEKAISYSKDKTQDIKNIFIKDNSTINLHTENFVIDKTKLNCISNKDMNIDDKFSFLISKDYYKSITNFEFILDNQSKSLSVYEFKNELKVDCYLVFVDINLNNIKNNFDFVIKYKDINKREITLNIELCFLPNDFFALIDKAYNRIGQDAPYDNIILLTKIYEKLKNYKYTIEDISKEYQKILKEAKEGGGQKAEIEYRVQYQYSEKIKIDIDYIKEFIKKAEYDYYYGDNNSSLFSELANYYNYSIFYDVKNIIIGKDYFTISPTGDIKKQDRT